MLIGVDGNEANVENRVGIGEFAFELLDQFKKLQNPDIKFRVYLKAHPLSHMPKEKDGFSYKIVGPGKMWTQFGLPFNLYTTSPRPDVFFTPSHYAPRFSPVPRVISVMDLSYIHFPALFNKDDLYQLTNWTKYSVNKSRKIITISDSSKGDIIKQYGVSKDKVSVVYPGLKQASGSIKSMSELENKYKINGKYILFVGTLQPRKNIKKLIESFAKILPEHKDLSLVIVGKKGWLYEEILEAPSQLGISENVKFLNFVSEENLPSLYKNAQFFILPSLYEGFGLPILEAMKNDCPVITSNVSSLPEAGGDAALYIDPQSADDIAEKMNKLLNSEELRQELIAKGRKQVEKFSWEKAAKEALEIIKEATSV